LTAGNLNRKVKYNKNIKQKSVIKQVFCLKPARITKFWARKAPGVRSKPPFKFHV
jgi:hypothetical protein